MFGRFGWAEILVIVILVLILFGHNKIPGMMKNLADGINTFKKEIKNKNPIRFLISCVVLATHFFVSLRGT